MSRRALTERASTRLLSLWDRQDGFGEPIGCVSTTYTLDPELFEEECLARFVGLETNPREDSWAYLVEREERLSQITAVVLVDKDHVPARRSLRWGLLLVRLRGGGVLHAKISILVWRNHIRVIVSSANLTEPGYRRNLEQAGVLDFSAEGGAPKQLLNQALSFVERVAQHAHGSPRATQGPHAGLKHLLQTIRDVSRTWPKGRQKAREPRAALLPVWPGEASLFKRVARALWVGRPPDFAEVLSPFYDPEPTTALVTLKGLQDILSRGGCRLWFDAPGRRRPDGHIELDLPSAFRKPRRHLDIHQFWMPEEATSDDGGEARPLHAKALWLTRGRGAAVVIGSSNFTAAGTGVRKRSCNIELNLGYWLPSVRSTFGRLCEAAYPHLKEVPLSRTVHFLEPEARTPESTPFDPLPAAFGLVLFRGLGKTGRLSLEIGQGAPEGFRVVSESGAALFDHTTWRRARRPRSTEVAWSETRPPAALFVLWHRSDRRAKAVWPVNVADAASLPPPEELRTLTLEELMAVLTSARPLHEAVRQVLRRRNGKPSASGGTAPEVDPHKKVDTSTFLLQRMRRLGRALEGLRSRLQQPVHSIEALRWRLHGPVGPLALAERLAEGDGRRHEGAAFLIAELARTLRREVDWSQAERTLGARATRRERRAVLGQLRDAARRCPAIPTLKAYVREAFR